MEINFREIFSSVISLAWFIVPYFLSIIGMLVLMLLKKSLRVLYYGSKRNRARPDDKAKSNLRGFLRKLFKEDTTGRTPGKLWHFSWLIIIFGAGSIILVYFLTSQTQNLFQRTDNTREFVLGFMRMFGMSSKFDTFRIIKEIGSVSILFAYLGVFQALLWRIVKDVKGRDSKNKGEEKIEHLKPLRRMWVTSWTVIFLIAFLTYFNTYFGTISAAVVGGVVGISCQTQLRGFVGWITLIMRQKFKKGMDVQIGDFTGKIERITPLAVVIKEANETNREIHIPTSTLFDQTIIDLSPEMDYESEETDLETAEDVTQS